ncbi:MAG TPA: hypothetical protein VK806_01880, partial [Bacteroidia bacterium]|nr:hypothetical protein [Bacteroidia bacterium]
MHHKKLLLVSAILLCAWASKSLAQQVGDSKWEIKDPFTHKVFIENKGQFKLPGNNEPVLFAFDEGASGIYFTRKGITYRFTKITAKEKEESARSKEEEDKSEAQTDAVNMVWLGSNSNVQVVAEEQTPDYFSYGIKENGDVRNVNNINAYKKITYKNLYPGIDVEFIFHQGTGIEYSLILHSGADASLFKMKYSDGHTVSIQNGDVHISTLFGDIIDHAPKTFYSANKTSIVASHFTKQGNTVSFALSNYDHSQAITIDPWTITPTFSNSNRIWNVQTDATGNVYLYGGDSPLMLAKYTSGGALIWTYNTPWDSSSYWLGTMITDHSGNSYITSGSNGEVSKINSGGGLVWHNNPNGAFSPTYEYWHEALNCDQTQLVIGGMYGTGTPPGGWRGAMMLINMASGAVTTNKVVGSASGF